MSRQNHRLHCMEASENSLVLGLGSIGDPRAVESLTNALLNDPYPNVRDSAASALGRIGDPRAVESLLIALKDPYSSYVRAKTAEALGEIKDARSVGPLIEVLQDASGQVGAAAANSLGQIRDNRAILPLLSALNSSIRKEAREALVKFGSDAVEPLTTILETDDWIAVQEAVKALGEIKDVRAVEPLIQEIQKGGARETWVAEALVEIGSPSIPKLVPVLRNTDAKIRERVAGVLEKIGYQPETQEEKAAFFVATKKWDEAAQVGRYAVEPLITAIKGYNVDISLRNTGNTRVTQPFNIAKENAINALGNVRDAQAVALLASAIKNDPSDSMGIARPALKALCYIDDANAVDVLVEVLSGGAEYHLRTKAAETLGYRKDARTVEPLIRAFQDFQEDEQYSILRYEFRGSVAEALGWIGDLRAVEPLIRVLEERKDSERHLVSFYSSVAEALGRIRDPRAVEPLIRALTSTQSFDWYKFRRSVAKALGQMEDPRVVPALAENATIPEAVEALVKIKDPRAIQPLVRGMHTTFSDVSGLAIGQALVAMGWEPRTSLEKVLLWACLREKDKLLENWDQTRSVLLNLMESCQRTRMSTKVRTKELSMSLGILMERSDSERRVDAIAHERMLSALHLFIGLGKEDIIPDLIDLLERYGDREMADDYLHCRNGRLQAAAEAWAKEHGYSVAYYPSTSSGLSGPSWGDWP